MRNKIILFAAVICFSTFFTACSASVEPAKNAPETSINSANTVNSTPSPEVSANVNAEANSAAASSSTCENVKRAGFALDKKQNFPLDFPPFEKSCFVVFHDPEFTNPALGAQYFIYRDGKEIFNFPEQFNGGNATCWVDAVAFEDINADQLKDIIVVGKCGEKSGSYNENMVYINTGKDFKVNKDANMEMMDFNKTSQIKDYVNQHQSDFAK